MTKKRRRPDTPPRSVPTVLVSSLNGNSDGETALDVDNSLLSRSELSAAVRALLAEDEPEALTPTPTAPPRPPRTLTVRVPSGVTPERANARTRLRGLAYNAVLIEDFSRPLFSDDLTDTLTDTVAALEETVAAVQRGELGDAEALLIAQAVTLNTIFARCAGKAAQNLEGQHLEGTERYLRLALKAQSQCRTTIETLAILKNPTTIFARQANIAQGPQQVNNTQVNAAPAGSNEESQIPVSGNGDRRSDASRARTGKSGPTKLLS